MKQRVKYELDRERKSLFENNKAFADRMGEIFAKNLKVEYWTDADEDGLTGGVTVSMEYENQEATELIMIENNKIEILQCDLDGDNEKEIELSEEELKIIHFLIEDGECYAAEEAAEAACYAKGPYHYNGVRRSDFY